MVIHGLILYMINIFKESNSYLIYNLGEQMLHNSCINELKVINDSIWWSMTESTKSRFKLVCNMYSEVYEINWAVKRWQMHTWLWMTWSTKSRFKLLCNLYAEGYEMNWAVIRGQMCTVMNWIGTVLNFGDRSRKASTLDIFLRGCTWNEYWGISDSATDSIPVRSGLG